MGKIKLEILNIEFNHFRLVIRKNEKFDNVNSLLGLVEKPFTSSFSIVLNIFIDHGILEHATSFLMFVRRVKVLNPIDAGPLVVHCSAGVGRTGCFIVIDALLERLKHEKTIDIYGHVTILRAQRYGKIKSSNVKFENLFFFVF
jgi:protein tyrosine phosphatase